MKRQSGKSKINKNYAQSSQYLEKAERLQVGFELVDSGDPPSSVSLVALTTDTHQHSQLEFYLYKQI